MFFHGWNSSIPVPHSILLWPDSYRSTLEKKKPSTLHKFFWKFPKCFAKNDCNFLPKNNSILCHLNFFFEDAVSALWKKKTNIGFLIFFNDFFIPIFLSKDVEMLTFPTTYFSCFLCIARVITLDKIYCNDRHVITSFPFDVRILLGKLIC